MVQKSQATTWGVSKPGNHGIFAISTGSNTNITTLICDVKSSNLHSAGFQAVSRSLCMDMYIQNILYYIQKLSQHHLQCQYRLGQSICRNHHTVTVYCPTQLGSTIPYQLQIYIYIYITSFFVAYMKILICTRALCFMFHPSTHSFRMASTDDIFPNPPCSVEDATPRILGMRWGSKVILVGGFNPIWKIFVKLEIFPK